MATYPLLMDLGTVLLRERERERGVTSFVFDRKDAKLLVVPYNPSFVAATCTEDQNREGVADMLSDKFRDEGIFPVEFSRSRDDGLELDALNVAVCFREAAYRPLFLPDTFETSHAFGGCDGEHPGRCHMGCEEWPTTLVWTPVAKDARGPNVWVIYNCEPR